MTDATTADAAHYAAAGKATRQATDWILVAAMLNTVLLSGAVQYFNIFALAGVNMLFQVLLLARARFRLSRKLAMPAAVVYGYLFYSFFVLQSVSDIRFIAFRFHDIFTALLLLNYVLLRGRTFDRTLEMLFIILIVHGFINWLMVTFFFPLFSTVPDIKSYQFLIFYGMEEKYMGIHRSQGLFWEPGVYQIYLNVALHYFLFYARKTWWAAAAFLGLVLTLSTTGVLIAAVQLGVYTFGQRQKLSTALVRLVVAAPFFLVYLSFTQTVVEDKIYGERSNSYLARSFDTMNGIMITATHPLGIGFNPATYQEFARKNTFGIDTPLVTDRGQTNGVLILAYSTGIAWAALILFFVLRQSVFPRQRLLFFLVLVGSLTTEPLFYSPFVWLFVVSGISRLPPLVTGRQGRLDDGPA